jgi:hypothetical protein
MGMLQQTPFSYETQNEYGLNANTMYPASQVMAVPTPGAAAQVSNAEFVRRDPNELLKTIPFTAENQAYHAAYGNPWGGVTNQTTQPDYDISPVSLPYSTSPTSGTTQSTTSTRSKQPVTSDPELQSRFDAYDQRIAELEAKVLSGGVTATYTPPTGTIYDPEGLYVPREPKDDGYFKPITDLVQDMTKGPLGANAMVEARSGSVATYTPPVAAPATSGSTSSAPSSGGSSSGGSSYGYTAGSSSGGSSYGYTAGSSSGGSSSGSTSSAPSSGGSSSGSTSSAPSSGGSSYGSGGTSATYTPPTGGTTGSGSTGATIDGTNGLPVVQLSDGTIVELQTDGTYRVLSKPESNAGTVTNTDSVTVRRNRPQHRDQLRYYPGTNRVADTTWPRY